MGQQVHAEVMYFEPGALIVSVCVCVCVRICVRACVRVCVCVMCADLAL